MTEVQSNLDLSAIGQEWTISSSPDTTPEVSDVLGDMPWWAARGLLYLIVCSVIVFILWASLSSVDIVVQSRGTLIPEGNVRPLQTAGGGIVQYVVVAEGDTVVRGQPLIQLDGTQLRIRLNKLREELATSREQLRQLMAGQGPVTATLEHQHRISRLESEVSSVELSLRQTTINAPVDGVISELGIRSAGAVLEGGQRVATIAPSGTRFVVEARVLNKDMAKISTGLHAQLKFDAYPFQDYGTIAGRIIEVSPDAHADKDKGSFYKVTILTEQPATSGRDQRVVLRPGLAVTAEIITERRTIANLILEPFRKLRKAASSVG